jgi:hypothetical protein
MNREGYGDNPYRGNTGQLRMAVTNELLIVSLSVSRLLIWQEKYEAGKPSFHSA